MNIHHDPEKRSDGNTSTTRWWIVSLLMLLLAGAAVFPTAISDVLANPPDGDVDFGELPDGRAKRTEGAKNRDSVPPAFPAFPPGGSRAAVAATATVDGLSVAHVELPDGRQQTTVIDVRTRAMAVYHVNPQTGVITLKSVRNLGWDLQIDDYNSGKPQPREVRALVERR